MIADAAQPQPACVADLMTRRPITVASSEPIEAAAALLRVCRIRHLPVAEGGALVGVLSLRDVLAAEAGHKVADLMSREVVTARPELPLVEAIGRLLESRISCLPVVEGAALVGIFTATDALRHATLLLDREGGQAEGEVRVEQLMTPRPLAAIEPREPLAAAWQLMRSAKVRHLPVMTGETLLGILSDRDVLAAGRDWLKVAATADSDAGILVVDAMSTRISTVTADSAAAEAGRVLMRRRVGALPVLRGGGIVGIVTVSDFMYFITHRA